MKLIATSKNRKQQSEVLCVTRDGWVVTRTGAMGDNGEDCVLSVKGGAEFAQSFVDKLKLTHVELSWTLGISRPTVSALLAGKRELTLQDYLILCRLVDDIPPKIESLVDPSPHL